MRQIEFEPITEIQEEGISMDRMILPTTTAFERQLTRCLLILLLTVLSLSFGCSVATRNYNMVGKEAFEKGQYTEAISEFQKAIAQDNRNSEAYYNLGATYYTVGKQTRNSQFIDQGEQLLRQSIALNPGNNDAHRTLTALLVETGRSQYAYDLLNSWQQRNPANPAPLLELARLSQELGDSNRATNYLTDALRMDANNPAALKAMGHVRERQGQLAMALENYTRSYQVDPRQADVAARIVDLRTQLAGLPSGQYASGPTTPPR
jgi:tetratricopeptide (TPR) repeat protein